MSMMLHKPRILCAVCLVSAAFSSQIAFAQSNRQPTGKVRLRRPQGQAMRVQKVDPKLQKVLVDWYNGTRTITKLTGTHSKYVYDLVFNVERRGTGKFYYEAPDKGRIDIEPGEIKKGEKSRRIDPRTKKPFALQASPAEKWLSNGKIILQVEPSKKKATRFPIPPKAQGRNIMDGPLPFLLGMPPQKALARYHLTIVSNSATKVRLLVKPKWKSDAANYQKAEVILNKENRYLPSAVRMIDPPGSRETVFTFYGFKINQKNIIADFFGRKKWWQLDLAGYKIVDAMPRQPVAGMPNLSGVTYKNALALSKKLNVKMEVCTATVAKKASHVNLIYNQLPMVGAPLRPGQKIFVSMFVDPKKFKAANVKVVPKLNGVHFKTAEAKLKQMGYRVELRRGTVTKNGADVYKVENQYPNAGQPALKNSKIVLWLLVNADDRKTKRTAARPASRK